MASPTKMCAAGDRDLLIVGAGTLGSLLVKQHRAAFPTARIVAETRSRSHLLLCAVLLKHVCDLEIPVCDLEIPA